MLKVDCCRELRHQLDEYQLKERELRKELRDLHLLQDQTHTGITHAIIHTLRVHSVVEYMFLVLLIAFN